MILIFSIAECVVGEWSEWINYHERTRTVSGPENSSEGGHLCEEIDTERRDGTSRNGNAF